MPRAMTSGARQPLSIALLVGLTLVIAAPFWHHDHHPAPAAVVVTDGQLDDLHVCSTGTHRRGPIGACPVCLSQRLLTQSQAEEPVALSAPPNSSEAIAFLVATVSFGLSHSQQPRAPPFA